MAVRAIRGATTVERDEKNEIVAATMELLKEILERNEIETDDIADIIFTATNDLTQVFPASSARRMGITDVPLLDMMTPFIDGALHNCIRIMLHFNTDKKNCELHHVYLRGAKVLRPDIVKKENPYIAVAIDGPAGAGKSSVSKAVAKSMGFVYIDTGAMYRSVALFAIQNGINPKTDADKLIERLDEIELKIKYSDEGQLIFLNGEDVTDKIRTDEVSIGASDAAVIPEVRRKLVSIQRDMAKHDNVIMDGRDICMYVLPDAQVKIFLTASVHERAVRRYREMKEKGMECDIKKIEQDIAYRDKNDSERKEAPLQQAPDAVRVDTTDMTFEESVEKIKSIIKAVK